MAGYAQTLAALRGGASSSELQRTLTELAQSDNRTPYAALSRAAQSQDVNDLQAQQLDDAASSLQKNGLTPLTALVGAGVKAVAMGKATKAQERRDEINRKIEALAAYDAEQAAIHADMKQKAEAFTYIQANQPIVANALDIASRTGNTEYLNKVVNGNPAAQGLFTPQGADTFTGIQIANGPDGKRYLQGVGIGPDGQQLFGGQVSLDEAIATMAPNVLAEQSAQAKAQAIVDEQLNAERALNAAQLDLTRAQADRARRDVQSGGSANAPAGYRYTANGNLEAIPGGPAAQKLEQMDEKQRATAEASIGQADRIISTIDQALGKTGVLSAGIGGALLSSVPGTNAKNLEADLQTVKANLGFAELQAMRNASPTGGALGAIAVQELTALQSTVASLDQNQSPDQLVQRLNDIKKHYSNWRSAVAQSAGIQLPNAQQSSAPSAAVDYKSKYGLE